MKRTSRPAASRVTTSRTDSAMPAKPFALDVRLCHSSMAWRMERSSRYAAALEEAVFGSSERRHALISDRVTSRSGIAPKYGRIRVARSAS